MICEENSGRNAHAQAVARSLSVWTVNDVTDIAAVRRMPVTGSSAQRLMRPILASCSGWLPMMPRVSRNSEPSAASAERSFMHVVVTGGRTYRLTPEDYAWMDALGITHLREGGAKGADGDAGRWALWRGVPSRTYPADWDRYGRAAGPIRNGEMLCDLLEDQRQLRVPIAVVAFPGGDGTRNCTEQAKALGIMVLSREPGKGANHAD
jgi:hypothetical protein